MEILEAVYIEGITHQPPRLPTKLFSIFESLWKVLKTNFQTIENTRNITNIALIFRICGVKVSKIQVQRAGGLGGRWVMPSILLAFRVLESHFTRTGQQKLSFEEEKTL
jgi:hypothetical protein